MGFSKQEYWSGLPFPPSVDLPDQGIEPHLLCLLHWQAGTLPAEPPGKPKLNTRDIKVSEIEAHINWEMVNIKLVPGINI